MNKRHNHLPALWVVFTWYAPMIPLFYLCIDLIDRNPGIHMIWISAILVFFALFAHVINPILYDLPVTILYIASLVLELRFDLHNRLGSLLFVSATLFAVYLLQVAIPYHLYKNQKEETHVFYKVKCPIKKEILDARAVICIDKDGHSHFVPELCPFRQDAYRCKCCTSKVFTWFSENRFIIPSSPLDPES